MMDMKVTCDINSLLKTVHNVQEKQLPYAMKEAANAVAFRARSTLIKSYPRKFHVRAKGLPNLIHVDKADKKVPVAKVYLDLLFMAKQEYGSEKVAEPGKSVPVPQEGVNEKGLTTKGSIKKNYYVSSLLSDAEKNKKRKRIRNGKVRTENRPEARTDSKYHPFQMEMPDGVRYIARHIAGSRKLEWMYAMHPKVVVPPRWGWQKIVKFVFDKYIKSYFDEAYRKAVSTARK